MSKKIQYMRFTIQMLLVIILILGFYRNARGYFKYVVFLSFFAGNYFCGWLCPFGTAQETFAKIGKKLFKKQYKMPHSIQKYLQFSRYVIYFSLSISVVKDIFSYFNGYKSFFGLVGSLPSIPLSIPVFIMWTFLLISIVFERPFCNYFCPEAYRFSIRSITRLVTITRNEQTCIGCKKCDRACPMNIAVSKKNNVRNIQCINCFKCIETCPIEKTLRYGFVFKKEKAEVLKKSYE